MAAVDVGIFLSGAVTADENVVFSRKFRQLIEFVFLPLEAIVEEFEIVLLETGPGFITRILEIRFYHRSGRRQNMFDMFADILANTIRFGIVFGTFPAIYFVSGEHFPSKVKCVLMTPSHLARVPALERTEILVLAGIDKSCWRFQIHDDAGDHMLMIVFFGGDF